MSNTILSRRLFLTISAAAVSSCALIPKGLIDSNSSSSSLGKLIFTFDVGSPQKFYVVIMDLDANKIQKIETPANIHFLEHFDRENNLLIGTNKTGEYLSVVNSATGTVKTHSMGSAYNLMGHTAFSADKRFLCATARRIVDDKNCIVILDQKTFAILDAIVLPDSYPPNHDCKFIPGTTMLVTTGGQNIELVDRVNKTVNIVKVPFTNPESQVRHFTVSKDGDMSFQSNVMYGNEPKSLTYSLGAVVTYDRKKNAAQVLDPVIEGVNIFNRELIDFQFSGDGETVAVTAKNYNYVTFWNFKTGKLIKSVDIPYPVRVTLSKNEKYFVIISGHGLRYITTSTLELKTSMNQFDDMFNETIYEPATHGTYLSITHRQTI